MDAGRRGFFRQIIRYAHQSTYIPRIVPRPPTALEEKDFIQACNGCGECVTACPNDIITIRNQHAELNLDLGYCSHCHQCNDACPTSALSHSISDCSIRPEIMSNCNPQTAFYCAECQHSCPTGAITINQHNKPKIALEKCNGCNLCQYNCPVSAITTSMKI